MRSAEKMTGNSIRDKARYLIGYNIRVKHLEYDNEEMGMVLSYLNLVKL